LDVFVHKARDIHNVCIYQKQDMYAKLCFMGSPDMSCSTKVINSGRRNPIFEESLRLDVETKKYGCFVQVRDMDVKHSE
jgi:hypothetical protein